MSKLNEYLVGSLLWLIPRAYALVFMGRTILAALFLVVATALAIQKSFDLVSILIVLAFTLGTFGCLPLFFSIKNCPVPKVPYAIVGLMVSGGWLLFAGITAFGMVYLYLPDRMFYWNIVALIMLADLPTFIFCLAVCIPKSRNILTQELLGLQETIREIREQREREAQITREPGGV